MNTTHEPGDEILVRAELFVPIRLPAGVPEQIMPPTMGPQGIPIPDGKEFYLSKAQGHSLYRNLQRALFNVGDDETLENVAAYSEAIRSIAKIIAPDAVTFRGKVEVVRIITEVLNPKPAPSEEEDKAVQRAAAWEPVDETG